MPMLDWDMNTSTTTKIEKCLLNPVLIVVHNLEICEGIITRRRKPINRIEESVLDYFLVNQRMMHYLRKMKVDDDEIYLLTNFAQENKNETAIKADHRPVFLKLNIKYNKLKPDKTKNFNFKSEECQKIFKNITDSETTLLECLKLSLTLEAKTKLWQRNLDSIFYTKRSQNKSEKQQYKINSKESQMIEDKRKLLQKIARNPDDEIHNQIEQI